ncbi:hypothetical protein ACI782_05630 [Geodermatophilus sp. SYSU D00703]
MNRFSAPDLRNSRSGGRVSCAGAAGPTGLVAVARPRGAVRLQTLARRYAGCPNAAHGHHLPETDMPHGQPEV